MLNFIGDGFPQTISIGIKNYSGYTQKSGQPTNKIIVLNLCSVDTRVTNGIVSRDLIYKNDSSAMWNMGTLRNI